MSFGFGQLLDPHSGGVLSFRWLVFLLAAGYTFYQLILSGDYTNFGGPLRFLTIWALILSFLVAGRNLVFTARRIDRHWPILIMVTAVLNAMVVGLYWRLYLADPSTVTGSSGPPDWHQQYYLHGVGPLLQWIDALFIAGAFVRWWRAILPLIGVIAVYVAWIELLVGRFSDIPVGSVTDGLPYPFLNSLDLVGRANFYGSATLQAMIVLMLFAAAGWAIRRFMSRRMHHPEAL